MSADYDFLSAAAHLAAHYAWSWPQPAGHVWTDDRRRPFQRSPEYQRMLEYLAAFDEVDRLSDSEITYLVRAALRNLYFTLDTIQNVIPEDLRGGSLVRRLY